METETIDRLFLELSQVTSATTAKELDLKKAALRLRGAMQPFAELMLTTSGRIPHERLSAADWHALANAYEETAWLREGRK